MGEAGRVLVDGRAVFANASAVSLLANDPAADDGVVAVEVRQRCERLDDVAFLAVGTCDLGIDDIVVNTAGCGPSLPTLSINAVSQIETDAGTTNFVFTVSLTGSAAAGNVTFNVAPADATTLDATRADIVRRWRALQLATVRAIGRIGGNQRVMRATHVAAGFRGTVLRDSHVATFG
mgnify:CR=1 FL=1